MKSCVPQNISELEKLIPFIESYNEFWGKNFAIEKELDLLNSQHPEPELLLRDGNDKMVIEHRILTWPANSIKRHINLHTFQRKAINLLSCLLDDDVYVLEINYFDIPLKRKKLIDFLYKLRKDITENISLIKSYKEIEFKIDNIDFSVKRLTSKEKEMEDDAPEIGIGINSRSPYKFSLDNQTRNRIKSLIKKNINDITKKFVKYEDCIRIIVFDIYTDFLFFDNTLLKNLLHEINLPKDINEIWATECLEDEYYEKFEIFTPLFVQYKFY